MYDLNMNHRIKIPSEYSFGSERPALSSSIEKYISSYEKAWWDCVQKHYTNIDYLLIKSDTYGNGTSASIDGWKEGFLASNTKLKELINLHGKTKVHRYLIQIYEEEQ